VSSLRVALIGLGDIALKAHLPALAREPRVTLVAVGDIEPGRLNAAPAGVHATTDIGSIIDDGSVDAVIVATPPNMTTALVRSALEAGKYVLAEKPLATSLATAAGLGDVPRAAERLQIGLTYRHHPAVDRLRETVRSGRLGGPLVIQAAVCDERADPSGDPIGYARRLRSLEHLPPIVSDGVHVCDRLNYLMGTTPVEDVSGWSVRTDDSFASANANGGVLRYADGSVARVDVIWLTPVLPPSQFIVTGSRGRAVLDPPTFGLTIEYADGSSEHLAPPGDKTQVCFALQLERFATHALEGTPPVPGLREALESQALAERIAEAADVAVMGAA
jgi:predicted dehydrogenase